MQGIQSFIAHDLFELLDSDPAHQNTMASVSFFEIYGGRCQDLLNNRNRLCVREDGHGEVVVADLKEIPVDTAQNLAAVIDAGNRNRYVTSV
jgi:kinesin family protein 2/24